MNKSFQTLELPIPKPSFNQIAIKLLASSLCSSNYAGWIGIVGVVTPGRDGHGPVGVVEAIGSSTRGLEKVTASGFCLHSPHALTAASVSAGTTDFARRRL